MAERARVCHNSRDGRHRFPGRGIVLVGQGEGLMDRNRLRIFLAALAALMAGMFHGCTGCDSGSGDESGGDPPAVICVDYDGDGYGEYYSTPLVDPNYSIPYNSCFDIIDCDDENASLWTSCAGGPYFTSVAGATVDEFATYTYNVVCQDDDPSANLSLDKSGADTCGGSLSDNGDGTGSYVYVPDETKGGVPCTVGISCADIQPDTTESVVQNSAVNVIETNSPPDWAIVPIDIKAMTFQVYGDSISAATDTDLPNNNPGNPGYLQCVNAADTCPFTVSVTGTGTGAVRCDVAFNAPAVPVSCDLEVRAIDGWGDSVSTTVSIDIDPCVFHVDKDATGLYDGLNWLDGFTVVQDGVDAAWAGCQVWVADGNYANTGGTEPVLTMKSGVDVYGGFAGNEIDLSGRGDPLDVPSVLDGMDMAYHVVRGAAITRLDGFRITGGNARSGESAGGGMFNQNLSNLTVANCHFNDNQATSNGGGLYNNIANVNIENCLFTLNVASGSGYGGAIYNYSSGLNIYDSVFLNNSGYRGGGVYSYTSNLLMRNCLLANNQAAYGGAIRIDYGALNISNSTVTQNNASNTGGGLYYNYNTPVVIDSIFWVNTAITGNDIYSGSGSGITVTYSDIGQSGTWDASTGVINANPRFAGGPYGVYYLNQATSPCVDSGSDTALNLGLDILTTDPDAASPVLDSSTVDMGYHYPTP